MVPIVLVWVLGVSLFVYGWGFAVVTRRHALWALVSLVGLAICVVSVIVGKGQHLVTY